MSTAIYVKGVSEDQQMLFSFGENTEMEDMFNDILDALSSQGFTMITYFMATSSEYVDTDLEDLMEQIQTLVYNW